MTPRLSELEENGRPLVLDASVLINLLATGISSQIIDAFGSPLIVERMALAEVKRCPRSGISGTEAYAHLVESGALVPENMTHEGLVIFLQFTGATPPNDLGDGEAATLAHAFTIGGVAVIDERKATRIASERLSTLKLGSTLDILCHSQVTNALGEGTIQDALFDALILARMRIPLRFEGWVRETLGPERLAQCSSLRINTRGA